MRTPPSDGLQQPNSTGPPGRCTSIRAPCPSRGARDELPRTPPRAGREFLEEVLDFAATDDGPVAGTEGLVEAMRYSLLAGGKRIRPVLCLATCEGLGHDPIELLPTAAALELIHTYSLIHDDLPSMDDDDLRRGRPTCHRAFGEDAAILAGDALFAEAIRLVAERQSGGPSTRVGIIAELSSASGVNGMVGGQFLDLRDHGRTSADALRLGTPAEDRSAHRLLRAVRARLRATGPRRRRRAPELRRRTGTAVPDRRRHSRRRRRRGRARQAGGRRRAAGQGYVRQLRARPGPRARIRKPWAGRRTARSGPRPDRGPRRPHRGLDLARQS